MTTTATTTATTVATIRPLMLKPADPAMQPDPGPDPNGERPIGELVSQLVEQGKAYAEAEFEVVKAIAAAKVGAFKLPAILFGAAFLFLQAAVTVLGVATFLALLPLMGPMLAGLLAFLIFAGVAGGLGWWAVQVLRRER
jgi:hypothetical protein